MPKGVKVNDAIPPAITWCDFCKRQFKPLAWNERTCFSCTRDGAPNQSRMEWSDYQVALKAFLRAAGRLAKATGFTRETRPAGRPFPRATESA